MVAEIQPWTGGANQLYAKWHFANKHPFALAFCVLRDSIPAAADT
jgi:hypothetical protein